ncbi:YoaK family protein [Arthrobacter sp. MI7-26]|uniref:YoaK family protein n=1 Tax=Arthrobacter sp. MI7-26 TaxID=2993653 RepID=UPI00224972EC|nr:YoaK family protein [Arthrobacter sp. MI7-26]MCX2750027.1 YoaK family protein [Arthrobacter sp. MI7-26]
MSIPPVVPMQGAELTAREPQKRRARGEGGIEQRWNRLILVLLLTLTFGTGIVDAIGYLSLNHVFIGNMTGNVAILGMALIGGDGLPVVGPLAALLCFALGAAVSGLVLRRTSSTWSVSGAILLLLAGLIVIAMGALSLLQNDRPDSGAQVLMSSFSAIAMGVQALVARKLAVRDVPTVVVTSTLTALAGELFHGSNRRFFNRRSAAILAILLGAAAGAVIVRLSLGGALIYSGLLILVVSFIGHVGSRPMRSKGLEEVI